MMKYILSFSLLLFCSTQLLAQGKTQNNERIENYKIAFFTKELNLAPEDAQKFWPLYNKMQDETKALRKNMMQLSRSINQGLYKGKESEGLELILKAKREELDIQEKYLKEIEKINGSEIAIMVPVLEGKFRHKLMQNMEPRNHGGGRRNFN
ncbi:hypothetical protein [Persicobacter psychrovividus]|uniref:LTXXQ motif family protein n=1 Tax=Persicobacter psychrovividus TaxID=387638 RepID=A0ABN6L7G9_9BACT|nr:hypothetical protein PEPS_13390 [Persicobacter psychrovividus]